MVTLDALGVFGDVGKALCAQEVDGGLDRRWERRRADGERNRLPHACSEFAERHCEPIFDQGAGVYAPCQFVELGPRLGELVVEPGEQ